MIVSALHAVHLGEKVSLNAPISKLHVMVEFEQYGQLFYSKFMQLIIQSQRGIGDGLPQMFRHLNVKEYAAADQGEFVFFKKAASYINDICGEGNIF